MVFAMFFLLSAAWKEYPSHRSLYYLRPQRAMHTSQLVNQSRYMELARSLVAD